MFGRIGIAVFCLVTILPGCGARLTLPRSAAGGLHPPGTEYEPIFDFTTLSGPIRVLTFPERADLAGVVVGGGTTPIVGNLSNATARKLFELARTHDDAPVLAIRGLGDEAAVETGLVLRSAPLGGRGKVLTFKRCDGEWKLLSTTYWVT